MMINDDLVFLNHAAIAPIPRVSYELVEKYNRAQAEKGFLGFDVWNQAEYYENTRKNVGKMINGSADGVALTNSTASALHLVADGLHHKFKSHHNIVITDIEFTTNSYLWQQVAKRFGLELRTIPFTDGEFTVENMAKYIDDNTILVSVSHVQFLNGYRINLKELSRIAKDHGSYLALDAIQSIGCVPFDIAKYDVDFLAAGGQKWQISPLGTGFFYAGKEVLDELESILVGWFSSQDNMNMKHHTFLPWNDAQRFQSTFDFNSIAYSESIKLLMRWDIKTGFTHVLRLLDYLIDRLSDFDYLTPASNLDHENRSGILKLDVFNGDVMSLGKFLAEKKVSVTPRDGGIRISPHVYNTKRDIDVLLENIKAWKNNQ